METAAAPLTHDHAHYDNLLAQVRERFQRASVHGPVFTTDANQHAAADGALRHDDQPGSLYDVFLDALPPQHQQHHRCRACRSFVEHRGHLVVIDVSGRTHPLLWESSEALELLTDGEPIGIYAYAVKALHRAVTRAAVTGIYLSSDVVWGQPSTRAKDGILWEHLAVTQVSSDRVFKETPLATAHQAMALKSEEYAMLRRALGEYREDHVRAAVQILQSETLYRSEKCLGVAQWLLDLHEKMTRYATPHRDNMYVTRHRDNTVWRAVATAPVGYPHVRSTMIGTLLDDLVAGLPHEDVARRFAAKMHPLQYQRPTAAPAAGNVAEAERIVAALGSAGALARRFARIEDVETLWQPPVPGAAKTPREGVFGHVKVREERPVTPSTNIDLPVVTMTFEKFRRTVLPTATSIDLLVGSGAMDFGALVTAVNPEAPPILQWDSSAPELLRNPVSWYLYVSGSAPRLWNLTPGWVPVTGVALQPSMWARGSDALIEDLRYAHQGRGAIFLLRGARDAQRANAGSERGGGFFPDMLRSEYHGVRATLEAHAKTAPIVGWEQATACGLIVKAGPTWKACTIRVAGSLGTASYRLDRWD